MKWKSPFDKPRNPDQTNLMIPSDPRTAEEMHQDVLRKIQAEKSQRATLLDRIEHDFSYQSSKPSDAEAYDIIRDTAKKLARVMVENCPNSRELSSAITRLEESVMHAYASISRNE